MTQFRQCKSRVCATRHTLNPKPSVIGIQLDFLLQMDLDRYIIMLMDYNKINLFDDRTLISKWFTFTVIVICSDRPFGCPIIYTDTVHHTILFMDSSTTFDNQFHLLFGKPCVVTIANKLSETSC